MSNENTIAAADEKAAKEDRHFVTALARGLSVLSSFSSGEKMLGNLEIAKRCKLPKSTVSRLTYTLTKLGYLVYVEETGRYRLGTSTLALGNATLPFLLALADKGWKQACADDPHLLAGLNVHAGHLTYGAVGAALGLEVMAPARALAA